MLRLYRNALPPIRVLRHILVMLACALASSALASPTLVGRPLSMTFDPRPVVVDPMLDFGTYLGGVANERMIDIGVDGAGNVYVVGTTSGDFPTEPPAPFTPWSFGLLFMSKLDPTGSTLLSSVVLGSVPEREFGHGVVSAAVDAAGNVYLTGTTDEDLPTLNAVQPLYGGGISDAFVAKLDPSGTLAFSTYLGGSGEDAGYGIAVDATGRIHVVGATRSGDAGTTPFPVKNAAQASFGGGARDAFVAQLDSSGALEYATYLGGEDDDMAGVVAANGSGSTWVAGSTNSADFPSTPRAWRPSSSNIPFLRSSDGGLTWAPSAAPIREAKVNALAVDPSSPTTVYAGTSLGGIYRSLDGGGTWTLLHRAPSSLSLVGIYALAVDPETSDTVYASAYGGPLRTRDGGVHWEVANVGLSPGVAILARLVVDPGHPETVYGFGGGVVFRSDDGADHWAQIATPDTLGEVELLAVDPTNSAHLVVASGFRVAQSFDRGQTWQVSDQTFGTCYAGGVCTHINTLVLHPTDPRIMYVGGSFGLSKTFDGGRYWHKKHGCLQAASQLLIDPGNPETLYGIGDLSGVSYGFVRSSDGGATWSEGGALPIGVVYPGTAPTVTLALAPGQSSRLYAAFSPVVYQLPSEGFMARYAADGAVLFSTFTGATPLVLDVDSVGNVYLPTLGLDPAGMPTPFTVAPYLDPLAISSLRMDAGGRAHAVGQIGGDVFAAEFDPAAVATGVCSVFTGVGDAIVSGLTVGAAGDTYVGLSTASTTLGVPNAYQATNGGGDDVWVAKIPSGIGGPITDCGPAGSTTAITATTQPTATCSACDTCGFGCTDPLRSAFCQTHALIDDLLCPNDLRAGKLRDFIRSKLDRVPTLLDRAAAGPGRKRQRALRRLDRSVLAIQKRLRRQRGLTDGCRESMQSAMATLRETIGDID